LSEAPALAGLQGWMQAALLDAEVAAVRDHVHGDNRLTAEARLGIYASAYRQRLVECLRDEYPVLAALAGATAFDLFAQGYVAAHPSQSYTMYDFGAGFADYLDAVRPAGSPHAVEAIPAALARIERARAEVHRAEGVEREATATETGLDPLVAAMLGLTVYRLPDSVRLLVLPFDCSATLAAGVEEEPPPLPQPVPSLLAVARAHYRVECHPLEPWQYDWLVDLPGRTGGDARIAAWLPRAIGQGLVVAC